MYLIIKVKHSRLYDLEYNAVKLRVMTSNGTNGENERSYPDVNRLSTHHKAYRFNPYAEFHIGLIANSVLWFSVTTWIVILSLFWTEFIPGFGKVGDNSNNYCIHYEHCNVLI